MSASVPHRHTGGSRFIMVAAALAAFIATFNETFLNVGFTPIMADLGVTVPTVQWLATAYMLGTAVMTPTAGFFITRFGTKPLFLASTSTLVIGGIVTALAPNFPFLLAGRIIQSIGTGLLVPIGMMIALTVSPKPKIGKYMGIMGSMTTLGPSIAILASGFILELTDSNWRALCWAFTALSALVFVVGAATVYNISESEKARLDYPSLVLVAIGLIGLLYGISTIFGPAKLTAAAAFFVGAVALGLFVKRQGTIANPLINLAPLRVFPFTAGVVINVVALIIVFSMNILVPTHLQSVQGTSGLTASLVLFPAILCAAVFGPIAGNIYDAHGARWLLPAGMTLMAIFALATAYTMRVDALWMITLVYIPAIVGSALTIGPVQSFALGSLPRQLNPDGVTIFSTSFQIAGCLGTVLSTGIYGAVLARGEGTDTANTGFFLVGAVLFALALAAAVLGYTGTRATADAPRTEATPVAPDSLVSRLMKTDVYHLAPDATIREALHLFVSNRISGAPLITNGTLRGFVSDGDVLNAISDSVPAFTTPYALLKNEDSPEFSTDVSAVLDRRVASIATEPVITVNVNDDLGHISAVLADRHLKKAPVVDDAGHVVGVINRSDINRFLVSTYIDA
ncbi:MFS transporter [Corynebacterium sanguinis]|uniref:MFS transporter n=1 Tax=Corynebacterium sanguinis TaxID=2594913 RepID=UPI0021AE6ECC|nr:MFS transporter [Corynebacterium sanguinis]MCT1695607.1 MFS transporter [Corynebacterium sanguinis]MCT1714977.1 MFS transporter [Corynebacterium sanguinis]